jgi:hypothetical protein
VHVLRRAPAGRGFGSPSRIASSPTREWGELILQRNRPSAGKHWSDSGDAHDDRGLTHRGENEPRHVPIPPDLVTILRGHFAWSAPGTMAGSPNSTGQRDCLVDLHARVAEGSRVRAAALSCCLSSRRTARGRSSWHTLTRRLRAILPG